MELSDLEVVLAVVEEGSISRAARSLHITQPAVSRRIARLERHLGVVLFRRTHVGAVPTPAARDLAVRARRLLADVEALTDAARGATRPTLHVAVPEEGLAALTPVVAAAYRAAWPDVDLRLERTDFSVLDDFVRGLPGAPDAVLWLCADVPGVRSTPVYTEPLQAVVGERSPLADAAAIDPVDLLDEAFVNVPAVRETGWADDLHLVGLRGGGPIRLTTSTTVAAGATFAAVADGAGIITATPGSEPGVAHLPVRFVPLTRPLRTATGVTLRADERRQHVLDLARVARRVGADLHRLVPGAGPPDGHADAA